MAHQDVHDLVERLLDERVAIRVESRGEDVALEQLDCAVHDRAHEKRGARGMGRLGHDGLSAHEGEGVLERLSGRVVLEDRDVLVEDE